MVIRSNMRQMSRETRSMLDKRVHPGAAFTTDEIVQLTIMLFLFLSSQ